MNKRRHGLLFRRRGVPLWWLYGFPLAFVILVGWNPLEIPWPFN